MKLIKISDDHYVVVDDSEIEVGDFVYVDCSELEVKDIRQVSDYYNEQYLFEGGGQIHIDYCKKITYTTDININELYYIPLEEVKELIGEVDVKKKKFEYLKKINEGIQHKSQDERIWIYGASDLAFTEGYNQCLEDNKDKKYTEEDIIYIIDNISQNWFKCYSEKDKKEHLLKIAKYLQKTEWEVELVEGKLKLK